MDRLDIDEVPGARLGSLCFLVATAAASHTLTREWRVDHRAVDSGSREPAYRCIGSNECFLCSLR